MERIQMVRGSRQRERKIGGGEFSSSLEDVRHSFAKHFNKNSASKLHFFLCFVSKNLSLPAHLNETSK